MSGRMCGHIWKHGEMPIDSCDLNCDFSNFISEWPLVQYPGKKIFCVCFKTWSLVAQADL